MPHLAPMLWLTTTIFCLILLLSLPSFSPCKPKSILPSKNKKSTLNFFLMKW